MGVIAGSIVAYAQPLLDATDGSSDAMNRAFTLAQLCWNLASLPEKQREERLEEMRPSLEMDDTEFEDFRQSVVLPMIRRHYEMFPNMPRRGSASAAKATSGPEAPKTATPRTQKYPGTARNAPCPCHSGKKYKRCCGR
jgi:uncharacterized protein YecA (UPF0149 family)